MTVVGSDNRREDPLPLISVVVIGRNEGARLVRCLESVRAADYPATRVELVYVDTDSTDESVAAAEKLGAKVVHIQPERPTAAAARNAGLRVSSHELVHFLDGDTILSKSWLKKAVCAISEPQVAAVYGRREEISPTKTIYHFWMHHDWYVPPGRVDACGGDVLFRRDVLLNAGGYDPGLIAGEERDLCFRLIRDQRIAILHLDEPMTLHDINMTRFSQYWRRCFRSGYAYAEVSARYPGLRSWRRVCLRNSMHAIALIVAVVLSFVLLSIWPVAIWIVLLGSAVASDAARCRARIGSITGALVYAGHHYLSKLPTIIGHLAYFRRRVWSGPPEQLIEYRGDA